MASKSGNIQTYNTNDNLRLDLLKTKEENRLLHNKITKMEDEFKFLFEMTKSPTANIETLVKIKLKLEKIVNSL